MRWELLALALLACPGPTNPTPQPQPKAIDAGVAMPPVDAKEITQEERLAAIQKAMNELDEAAQLCWAAAAVERFDIEGDIKATIDIAGAGTATRRGATVTFALDTTRNKKLGACLTVLLEKYPWAPPLHGQAIQLPFKFRAPSGQNLIDRNLVPFVGQGKVSVAVLIDESNTGNGAASILEVAIAAGGSTGARIAERAELWYFLGAASIETASAIGNRRAVMAGDMMYVPAKAARNVIADADLRAVVVIVPGGREGTARAGAMPTREVGVTKVGGPMYLPAKTAKQYTQPNRGVVSIFAEPATIKDKGFAATVLELPGNVKIPEHVHAGETELLYVLAGTGTFTVGGVAIAVTPTSTIQVPPNTKHSFAASADFRALQIYTPAGPEQRFKVKP